MYEMIVFMIMTTLPPPSTLFPYTTLFRSKGRGQGTGGEGIPEEEGGSLGGNPDAPDGGGIDIGQDAAQNRDRKSTRLNSSHITISYAVFCLKKKKPTLNVVDFIVKASRRH